MKPTAAKAIVFHIVTIFFGLLVALAVWPAYGESTESGSPDINRSEASENEYIRRLEKRVAELEAIVRQLAEKAAIPVKSPEDTTTTAASKSPEVGTETETTQDDDEWEDPEVKAAAGGRDQDARRRVSELETWRRKKEARSAKDEEEAAGKAKIELTGKYKLQYNIRNNLHLNNPNQFWKYDDTSFIDQRFQLGVEAVYGPLSAEVVLDKGNFLFDWKEGTEGTFERWGEFLTANTLFAREIFFQYTGPVVIKAGRHDINDPHGGVILQGPTDGLKLVYPLGKTPFGRVTPELAYLALGGGYNDYTDFLKTGPPAGDRSAVFGLPNKLDGWYFNLEIKPSQQIAFTPYVLKVYDRGDFGDPDFNLDKDFDKSTTPRDGDFEPLYLGVAVHGEVGRLAYQADLISVTGSYSDTRDINGYAGLLKGDYRLGDVGPFNNLLVGLEFARGSGNRAEDSEITGTVKDFNALWVCRDRRKYGNIFSEDLNAGIWLWDSNLANVSLLRAVAEFEPRPDWQVEISLTKLWATESVFVGRGPVGDWSRGTATGIAKTNDIGWEIDLNFRLPLHKHLEGYAELGYFIPGEVYQQPDGQDPGPATEIVIGAEFVF